MISVEYEYVNRTERSQPHGGLESRELVEMDFWLDGICSTSAESGSTSTRWKVSPSSLLFTQNKNTPLVQSNQQDSNAFKNTAKSLVQLGIHHWIDFAPFYFTQNVQRLITQREKKKMCCEFAFLNIFRSRSFKVI